MPFQALPSSPGFQLPPVPRWEGFAEKAIDLISKRPIVDTASIVDKAADQINEIIKMNSPEAKMQRQFKRMLLDQQIGMMKDYKLHPDKYEIGKGGMLVLRDKNAQLKKQLDFDSAVQNNTLLHRKVDAREQPDPRDDILDNANDFSNQQTVTVESTGPTPKSPPGARQLKTPNDAFYAWGEENQPDDDEDDNAEAHTQNINTAGEDDE